MVSGIYSKMLNLACQSTAHKVTFLMNAFVPADRITSLACLDQVETDCLQPLHPSLIVVNQAIR